jgi:hypothetical protein
MATKTAIETEMALQRMVTIYSAVTELAAVTLFALNPGITLMLPPPRPPVTRDASH